MIVLKTLTYIFAGAILLLIMAALLIYLSVDVYVVIHDIIQEHRKDRKDRENRKK